MTREGNGINESDDEHARREQAERWREEIAAAKSGREQPPTTPREFTDPTRREPSPADDEKTKDVGEEG